MLLTVLENTRTTTDFYIKTLHMYEARIMKELFLADYQRLTYAEQGSVNYNVGRVIYEQKEERTFRFTEILSGDLEKIATDLE